MESTAPALEEDKKPKSCEGCPNYHALCVMQGQWDSRSRLTLLGESPSWASVGVGKPFKGSNGILLRKLIAGFEHRIKDKLPGNKLAYSEAYAVGASGKPQQEAVAKCTEIWKTQWIANFAQQAGTHVIVPFGLPAAKSIGINAKKIMDIRGRLQTRMVGTRQVHIIPTLSLATLYVKPGLATVVQQDLLRAVKLAYMEELVPQKTIAELAVNYRFPKTIEEVRALCDEIINYYDPEKQNSPWRWPIAVDTETNTVKPFRRDAKVLMVSFGWDDGKAGAILLDHQDNDWYDPKLAWAEVKRVLECPKPKVFHNCKFDLQFLERVYGIFVNNVEWDTMCGQHWISEDQKGVYGLKALSPLYAPAFEGYEETLHKALRKGEQLVPTEADTLKEAQELAAASGESSDTSWFEEFVPKETEKEAEEEEEKEPEKQLPLLPQEPHNPNQHWLSDPEWPEGTSEDQKKEYTTARFNWFKCDEEGNKKARTTALREWKKIAHKLEVPAPRVVNREKWVKKQGFEAVGLDVILPYAAADADLTRLLLKGQWRKLMVEKTFPIAEQVMKNLYLPGSRTLGGLEFRGSKVDLELAQTYETQLAVLLNDAQKAIYNLACRDFKILASRQLATVLLSMGFLQIKETTNKDMSTSKDVLISYQKQLIERLKGEQTKQEAEADKKRLDFIEAVLLYRTAHKMKSSFLRNIREYSALDGHIHTTFHLTGTSTGRLSSAKLNLQNLPLYMCRIERPNPEDPENPFVIHPGFNVKKLIIPDSEDEVFWNLDIQQAEIRVACYYSGDVALIKALNEGLDIHTFFTTKIKHPTLEGDELQEKYFEYLAKYKAGDHDISKFRAAVKRVVFGTLYGAGPAKIAAQIGGGYTKEAAREIISALFTAFPGIKKYVFNTKEKVHSDRFVSTVFGRYRRFLLTEVSGELRSKAEREAVNSLIQSTSSDLVLAQLCEIDAHLNEIDAIMRLTVHDSMAGTIKKHRVKDMQAFFDYWLVERIRERFPWLPVPFSYDLEIGPSYGEKSKYEDWLRENPKYAATQTAGLGS